MAKFQLVPFGLKNTHFPEIGIEVEINQNTESIFISYRIRQGLSLIELGESAPDKTRHLKLWEKTCFELFIKNEANQYIEFNFSPNFQWNCFYFNFQGEALKEWEQMQMPVIDVLLSSDHYLLFAEIKKDYFPEGFFDTDLHAGITSVIKDKKGTLSYWALSHADTRPNFHHFDSFKYKF
ncbi:MAG: hypothetical protein Q7U04_04155 [Bacteriovorax sp.]|nr:hypothetical protein [Bacteriovorax sp.]